MRDPAIEVLWAKETINQTCLTHDALLNKLHEYNNIDLFAAAWIVDCIEDNYKNNCPFGYKIDYSGKHDDCFNLYCDALTNSDIEFNHARVLDYVKAYEVEYATEIMEC
jgi:hypothetical protein